MIRIAQAMPEVTFNCVMPKDKYEEYKENFGKNMVVKSDIPEQEFLEFMCQSQLVVTPLDTEAPAGLIAFYQAAANGKMAITSDTVTTQEYFADGRGALCGKDIEDWKIKFSTICRIEKKLTLVRQSLRVSLNVSVLRRNMQRYCGRCLRDEREI